MVLTKAELIAALQNEVRILLHLIDKIEPGMDEYRPSAGQRSTLDLLRYLAVMGPGLVRGIVAGAFDPVAWTAAQEAASTTSLDNLRASVASQPDVFVAALGALSEEDFRDEVEMFGRRAPRGVHLVTMVLCGYAAYRTQLFLYLKASGRPELGTMNLWAGIDAPVPA